MFSSPRLAVRLLAATVAVLAGPWAGAQPTGPSPTGFYIEPVTAPGALQQPVDVEVSADGRIFVLTKSGVLWALPPDGTVPESPWLSLRGEVYDVYERGALGFALHPDFPETPHVYVVYTVDDSPRPRSDRYLRAYGRVTRFSARPDDPSRADPASRRVLVGEDFHDGIPSCYLFHSVGTVEFGHDGSLFVGAGDAAEIGDGIDTGGRYDECVSTDPDEGIHPSQDIGSFRSQSLESLAGKVLRIDPETGGGLPDNPFFTGDPTDAASKVWAYGLRNPFRFSVAPASPGEVGPGTLLIGDVGQATWEEINRSRGGENFGWPCYEGPFPYGPGQAVTGSLACPEPQAGTFTGPYAYWNHHDPDLSSPAGATAYSITGGLVYTGAAYPEAYQGALFFADYAQQWVRAARIGPHGFESVLAVGEEFGNVVDLALEPSTGELLAADVLKGQVVRVRHAGGAGSPPVARLAASALTAAAPAEITFSAESSFDPDGGPLEYRWTLGDGTTGDGVEVTHAYETPGVYAVTVAVANEAGVESRASVSVRVGRGMPTPKIASPTAHVLAIGSRVELRGAATDPVDTDETFAYEWAVDLVHNDHVHERFFYADGPDGGFVLAPHASGGETDHYRVTLTVTDSEGLVSTATRTLRTAVATEVDLAPATPIRPIDGGVEVVFPRPIRVGRVGLPGLAAAPEGLAVELRQRGEWQPARFPSALPEGDAVQVLFVAEMADAVRVRGADTLAVYGRVDAEADLPHDVEGIDVGVPVGLGRSGLGPAGALVLVGGGAAEQGAAHLARRVLSGDGAVAVRLDALAATAPTAGAGVSFREGTDPGDRGVSLLAEPGGTLALWAPSASSTSTRTVVGAWEGPLWLRLRRDGARIVAETSGDGAAWEAVGARLLDFPAQIWSGPAVTAGDVEGRGALAIGWFGDVVVEGAGRYPDATAAGPFAIEGVYPNPTRGAAALVLDAGRAGSYEAELVDLLGRVVWQGAPASTAEVRELVLPLGVEGVGAGVYVVRVRHVESGEVQAQTITVVR